MKQLLIIIVIFLAVTAGTTSYFLLSGDRVPPEDVALTVNGRSFTLAEVEAYLSGRFAETGATEDGHHGDRDLILKAFAEERVLIQEAQRLKIDQEPDFREKIQRYYEYSLISALRNRLEELYQRESLADEAALEQAVDRFLDLYGRQITFSIAGGEASTLPFDMIPNMYKPVLADMEPGQTRQVILTGNTVNDISLIEIGPRESEAPADPDREQLRRLLLDYRTGVKLNAWNQELIDKAAITYRKEQ